MVRKQVQQPPVYKTEPAQFPVSNAELRQAIRETNQAIKDSYDGARKDALHNHLVALLEIERFRAAQLTIDTSAGG